LLQQFRKPLLRLGHSDDGWTGGLSAFLAPRLGTRLRRVSLVVQNIVGDLKSQPEVFTVAGDLPQLGAPGAGDPRADGPALGV